MNTARWKQMVEKEYDKWLDGPQERGWLSIPETLLARQHAAMVRLVKKIRDTPSPNSYANANTYTAWHQEVCDKILAELATQGRGKK